MSWLNGGAGLAKAASYTFHPWTSPTFLRQVLSTTPCKTYHRQNFTRRMSTLNTFSPRRVLIVAKTTRYEMEKRIADADDEEIARLLKRRGTNVNRLLQKHDLHKDFVEHLRGLLKQRGVETRVVERADYTPEAVAWADAIFAAGGDGTFLLAASQVTSNEKPVIGVNTDPNGSEGYMCIVRKESKAKLEAVLEKLWRGEFQWMFRARIRVELTAEGGAGESMQLHSTLMNRDPATNRWEGVTGGGGAKDLLSARILIRGADLRKLKLERKTEQLPVLALNEVTQKLKLERKTEQLPVLALNEVYIGESLSSRVSYYELCIDGGKLMKQKSSGLTVCTGTGSTSWYFNINKMMPVNVEQILQIAAEETGLRQLQPTEDLVTKIGSKFNQQLTFSPETSKMAFCVRDPIFNSTFLQTPSRGLADEIYVKSRGYDSHLVVDGGVSFAFNDGAEATLRVNDEDALRTVVFR